MKTVSHLRTAALAALLVATPGLAWGQAADPTPQRSPASESAPPSPATPSAPPADSTQLEVIESPPPDYPLEAAGKAIEGKVWIQLHISETGKVVGTEVVSGDPLLAKAAESAMASWRFKPFFKDGKPARVSTRMSYNFVLNARGQAGCILVEAAEAMNLAHKAKLAQETSYITRSVMEGSVIHRVDPPYPEMAKIRRIKGDVILLATIGKDGLIHDLRSLCGDPILVESSIWAVKQWRYRPYTLEGNPVDVQTTIKVQFHM